MTKSQGWHKESFRHSLASRGISTKSRSIQTTLPTKYRPVENPERYIQSGPINWDIHDTGFATLNNAIVKPNGMSEERWQTVKNHDAELIWLTPDELIDQQIMVVSADLQNRGIIDSPRTAYYRGYNQSKIKELQRKVQAGIPLDALFLEYDTEGDLVPIQEGRHRALLAKNMNVDKVPVWIIKRRY